ncbi:MAG: transposase [Lachnoclostridium sp.]|nr:transposase [Lachnoclostridium sp.]
MSYSTTNTYTLKRKILTFTNRISKKLSKPERKFTADLCYGMLASHSCLLTDISDQLHEKAKKIHVVNRLSRHLQQGIPKQAQTSYLSWVRQMVPPHPVIHLDDSDVVKPNGQHFEALRLVRDGSESTATKNVYKKGYLVTEATALTKSGHPISIFSKLHSSQEKDYKSVNTVTFSAINRAVKLFQKATFVMDRGYDNNKIFLKLEEEKQDYVIRLTRKRKLLFHNQWVSATELCNRRKGKVKLPLCYRGRKQNAYLSHVNVQITASRKKVNLVLIYGISEHPMMLVTNQEIKGKEDIIRIAKLYFSRWRIEEYFRCKKQVFQFENFRVRKLVASNALNFYITLCMAFLAGIVELPETSSLKYSLLQTADPLKPKVSFCYYRFAKGIRTLLAYAREGVRLWFRTKRPTYRQLCLPLLL